MRTKITIEVPETMAELRTLAKRLGIAPGRADKKTLVEQVATELRRTAGLCTVCRVRRPGTGGSAQDRQAACQVGLCIPCLRESEWENIHSDHYHDPDSSEIVYHSADDSERGKRVRECWVCFPELNRARNTPQRGRYSVSRKGMVMHVSRRMNTEEKAKVVADALAGSKIVKRGEEITVVGQVNAGKVKIVFDRKSRTIDPSKSSVAGRKVYNVAGALRLIERGNR